jgi:hypothetical protein
MPLFRFYCKKCGLRSARILEPEVVAHTLCKVCGEPLAREVTPPSSDLKEVVDNGIMHKRLEIYPDARKLLDERSKADERNRRTTIFEEPNE